ncbi:hypothetical protein CL622_02205 [archaeon]|nr:hypothetical protein [archaeon]|tara:strand:+ start:390 stop:695 length:306 start_codon:yes stop_codon:yes gene_type:complete
MGIGSFFKPNKTKSLLLIPILIITSFIPIFPTSGFLGSGIIPLIMVYGIYLISSGFGAFTEPDFILTLIIHIVISYILACVIVSLIHKIKSKKVNNIKPST